MRLLDTHAGRILAEATTPEGATTTRRQKGFSDHNIFEALVLAGLCEWRTTGPRGGRTLHATPRGVRATVERWPSEVEPTLPDLAAAFIKEKK